MIREMSRTSGLLLIAAAMRVGMIYGEGIIWEGVLSTNETSIGSCFG